jgi:CubicO group peptidase (beta-lactamase class C family)
MEDKIWKPLGMQDKAYWLIDNKGMEVALGGLNVSTRDFAKLGQLYLQKGVWGGKQIVPEDWVHASLTPDAPHIQPGKAQPFGYGYQWWIPEGGEGEFLAMGVYDQYIYVNPKTRTVIMKNSANHKFNEPTSSFANPRVLLEFFRSIAHQE